MTRTAKSVIFELFPWCAEKKKKGLTAFRRGGLAWEIRWGWVTRGAWVVHREGTRRGGGNTTKCFPKGDLPGTSPRDTKEGKTANKEGMGQQMLVTR